MVAVSLIEDPGAPPNNEALLFSALVESKLRSLLVKGEGDLVGTMFPRLDVVYCQNPTKLTSTQLLGTLLSSEPGPCSLCASVLPMEVLATLCRTALSYQNLKIFFALCRELLPTFVFVETSAQSEAGAGGGWESQSSTLPVRLDPSTEAAAEVLMGTMRDKLLQLRSSSVPTASQSPYLTPIKPLAAARQFLEPNPLLDQWLRGLWSLQLDPQSPSLSLISARLACAAASSSHSASAPNTDSSTCSLESIQEDATLLIEAKLALINALTEKQSSSAASAQRSTFRLRRSTMTAAAAASTTSGAEHSLKVLWPCLVLAEAMGNKTVLVSLLGALQIALPLRLVAGAECDAFCDSLGLDLCGKEAEAALEALSSHWGEFGIDDVTNHEGWSPETDRDSDTSVFTTLPRRNLKSAASSSPYFLDDASITADDYDDDNDDDEWGAEPSPLEPPPPQSAPGYPLASLAEEMTLAEAARRREALFDRSIDSHENEQEQEQGETSHYGDEYEDEPNDEISTDGSDVFQQHQPRLRNGPDSGHGSFGILPSLSDFEPPSQSQPRLLASDPLSSSPASSTSNATTLQSSTSFRDNSISRSLAMIRVQPLLREKKAKQAAMEAEKTIRASRLKSVELAQRMARVGWGSGVRSNNHSRHVAVSLQQAAARQSWAELAKDPTLTAVALKTSLPLPRPTAASSANSTSRSSCNSGGVPQLSESAKAAQKRAAQRVKERSMQLLTKEQQAVVEKKEREDAMWRERDRRIKLFVERQKGGRLYLMSTGSTGAGAASPLTGGYAATSSRYDSGEESDGSGGSGDVSVAIHSRQPWAVGTPDPVESPAASGFFTLRRPETASATGVAAVNVDYDGDYYEDSGTPLPPPPPPPLSNVSITVLRARNLLEGLGGCNPYVLLDWAYLGRHATEPTTLPVGQSMSMRSNTNPTFGVKLLFKPPFLWAGESGSRLGPGAASSSSSLYDLDRELDAKEVYITTPIKTTNGPGGARSGDDGQLTTTTAATLCAPILRVYVYSRNVSVSDELLGEGEVDVETMLYACQQGVPFTVELFDSIRMVTGGGREQSAGSVEMRFELGGGGD